PEGKGERKPPRMSLCSGGAQLRPAPSNAKAFAATAFALDVGVAKLEGLVQAFLHVIDLRSVDQLEALAVDDDLHVAFVEDDVVRVDLVGIVDHVGPARAAGALHPDPQTHAVTALLQVAL